MDELNRMDVLFVGAGPASLAGAIRLKQLLKEAHRKESVVVIEKADKLGQHNLSGAVFEADVLDHLTPYWREDKAPFVTKMLANEVKRDEMILLVGNKSALEVPPFLVPSYLHHKGNYIVSISEMVNWLAGIARDLGVEIYTGFTAKELVIDEGVVKGINLGEKGLNQAGEKQPNYISGEILRAQVTVFGEGSLGLLSEKLIKRFGMADGKNPQIYSLGVKEIIRLPNNNSFGPNRVIHTVGFPNKFLTPDIFGGGTLYSLGPNTVAVALILALDWKYADLDLQRELQLFKSHRHIRSLIDGGEVISYGAKTLPEGGFYSVPKVVTDGALIIGDSAGLTNVRKLKGLHYAIESGILASEAVFRAIEDHDFSRGGLELYEDLLNQSFVMKELRAARNYRQVFSKAGRVGFYVGAPLSLVQQWIPFRLGTEPDFKSMKRVSRHNRYDGGIDRLSAVSLSGTIHREEEPSHITFRETGEDDGCYRDYGCHPCAFFCPGGVYKFEEDRLILSPSNCLHCQTCRVKCPHQVIQWQVPEGGDGPRYRNM